MGIFSAIGGFLGLVNKNETASEIAKDISSGVDMMFYTDEEKAIDSAESAARKIAATEKAMDTWLTMVQTMKSSESVRSITRRIIAFGYVFNIFAMIWACIAIEALNAFGITALKTVTFEEIEVTALSIIVLKFAAAFQLGWALCTIIIFYFGPQLAQILKGNK